MAQRKAQELDIEQKLQPVIFYPPDNSTFYDTSVPSHQDAQSEKGDSVAFELSPRNHPQDDYPDGGLHAWLMVLGVSPSE